MKKEYILTIRTWDDSRKKHNDEHYILSNATINGNIFKADSIKLFIKDVIFNGPATIVKWSDGTKTVVKCCEGDTFDPEKGLAMAISKKALGDLKEVKKWTKEYEKEQSIIQSAIDHIRNIMRGAYGL